MKKIFNAILLVAVILLQFTACKKEGKIGPPGPDGPAGDPGDPGLSGSMTSAGVLVYELVEVPADDLALFRWVKETGTAGDYHLEYRLFNRDPYKAQFRLKEQDRMLAQGTVIAYLSGYFTSNAQGDDWFHLPHVVINPRLTKERYSADFNYVDDPVTPFGSLYVRAVVQQLPATNNLSPIYNIEGIRIIVIGAGTTGIITGRFKDVPDQQLSMSEIMTKYNITEADFQKSH